MLKTQHETVLIVALCASVFFGSIAGGFTSFLLVEHGWFEGGGTNDVKIEGVSKDTEKAIAGLVEEQDATIAVVKQVTPAVVSIYLEKKYPQYGATQSDVTYEYQRVGGGSGFIVSTDGLIVTNKHVVSDADAKYVVATNDGTEYDATVVAKDVFLDVAFVKIEGTNFPTVKLGDSDGIQTGQTVLAIGNVLSQYQNSVTKGIVSGLNRTIVAGDGYGAQEQIDEAIQTDAPINAGNSGGPLINLYGEVLGVNSAVSTQGESLGFSIPINVVKPLLADVVAHGRIIRPWLGVRYVMINPEIKKKFALSVDKGALVVPESATQQQSVVSGSPAALAGIKPSDIVISVSGIVLDDKTNLSEAINTFDPDQTVKLEILRGTDTVWVDVTLKELDPSLF